MSQNDNKHTENARKIQEKIRCMTPEQQKAFAAASGEMFGMQIKRPLEPDEQGSTATQGRGN